MYYMCTGGDIKTNRVVVVLPEEDHFQAVSEKCRDVLRYIFKMRKGKIKHSIKDVRIFVVYRIYWTQYSVCVWGGGGGPAGRFLERGRPHPLLKG